MDKKVHPVYDLLRWGKWMQDHSRRVMVTEVGDQSVSTVFLGLDHSYDGGEPVLFETMVFPEAQWCERYTTYRKAINGHNRIVAKLNGTNVVPLKRAAK